MSCRRATGSRSPARRLAAQPHDPRLTADGGRQVYLTWEIDWVPETAPARTDIAQARIRWLDVAGPPQVYPVFDAERSFDLDGDGQWSSPTRSRPTRRLPATRSAARSATSASGPSRGAERPWSSAPGTCIPVASTSIWRSRATGPTPATVDGDDPSEVRQLFRSDARYYDPAGAVSWDVSMEATRPDWRIAPRRRRHGLDEHHLRRQPASWYESMGILPLAWSNASDPAARDPFDDDAAVRAMYDAGGILTHGRLPENIDNKARKKLKLPDPRRLKAKGRVPADGIEIDGLRLLDGRLLGRSRIPREPDAPAGDPAGPDR